MENENDFQPMNYEPINAYSITLLFMDLFIF